jgi:hypothetical protein
MIIQERDKMMHQFVKKNNAKVTDTKSRTTLLLQQISTKQIYLVT